MRASILEMFRLYLPGLGSCDTESDLARRRISSGSGEEFLDADGEGELSGVIAHEYGGSSQQV